MVTCKLMGQMANQMFQVAATVAHALRVDSTYSFPLRSGKRDQFSFMFPYLPQMTERRSLDRDFVYRERIFGVYNPLPQKKDLHLEGYFQSEKYFEDYKDQIVSLFDIPIYSRQQGVISVHVRRGDYIRLAHKHPPVTVEYLSQAMNQFDKDRWKFMFFSDDINWCKENFKGERFLFSEGKSMKEDMGLQAACEHHIISNSTYSWWAAWLGEQRGNDNRIVIAPKQWFGPRYQDRVLQTRDIIPERWIKL